MVDVNLLRAVERAEELVARPLEAGFNVLDGLGEARTVLSADPVANTLIVALTRGEINATDFVEMLGKRVPASVALARELFDVGSNPQLPLQEVVRRAARVEVGPPLMLEIAALADDPAKRVWPGLPVGPLGGGIVLERGGIGTVSWGPDVLTHGIPAFPMAVPTISIYGGRSGSQIGIEALRSHPMSIYPPRDWADVGRYLRDLSRHSPFPSLRRLFNGFRYGESPNTVDIRVDDEHNTLLFETAAVGRGLHSHAVATVKYEPERGRRRLRVTAGAFSPEEGDVRFYRSKMDDYLPRDLPPPTPADHVGGLDPSATGWLNQRPVLPGNGRVNGRADPDAPFVALMLGAALIVEGFGGELQGFPSEQVARAVRSVLAGQQPDDDSVVVTLDQSATRGAPWGAWLRTDSRPLYVYPVDITPASYGLAMQHVRSTLEAGYEIQRNGGRVQGTPIYGATPVAVTFSMPPRVRPAAGGVGGAGAAVAGATAATGAAAAVPDEALPALEPIDEGVPAGAPDASGRYSLTGDRVIQDDLSLRVRPRPR